MKKLIHVCIIVAAISASCNSNSSQSEHHAGMSNMDSMDMQQNTMAEIDVKNIPASFTNVDPGVVAFMKSLVQHYLDVKNALVNSNESEAGSASEKILVDMRGFDESLLTAEQKKVYDDVESDLKEHAEHIAKSKVDHQRDHFTMMSEDVYNLVKAYGAGMPLYHDHCPMYKDGAMWLSETKEIRNPYYGNKMMTCGTTMEMFK